METTLNYIKTLTSIPSPTGFTQTIMTYIIKELEAFGYSPIRTNKGGVMVSLKGKNDTKHRMITAHLDTLGAMVRAIKPDGRLKIDLIGGYTYNAIEGENCTIHLSKNGKEISGTALIHQTSVHVYKDAGTAERFIKSRYLDDKVSAGILMELLSVYKKEDIQLPYTTHFYFSAFEELGHGANSSIPNETVEYLAVDMGAMGDDQETDEYTVSICVKDASGPYHYELRQHLVSLAENNNIPYKLDIYPYYGSDASAAMRAGAEVKHALLGAGIESSHSYERTHIDSIQATELLVDAYLKSNMVD